MEKFVWTSVLDVTNPDMNHEHKVLIDMMEDLNEKNQISLDKTALLNSFDGLIAYTRVHFADEEKFMAMLEYPELDQHRRIHEGLLETLEKYRGELHKSVSGRFPSSVFDFFKTWITTHILLVDKQYANFVAQKIARAK